MGLFDSITNMFGRGAAEAAKQPNSEQRFNELKQKYQTALNLADQQQVRFQNLHIQDNKLFIRAIAPSEDVKNKFWDQVKLANPSADDITADISVDQTKALGATVGGGAGQAGQKYTVKSGDTLSRISRQFYGDGGEYMRIFYANRTLLTDPNRINVGQELVIPPDDDA
jgi:nucleoid-associated protein YgaU